MRLRLLCGWATVLAMSGPCFADTPRFCLRITDLPPVAVDALRPSEKEAAEAVQQQAGNIAKRLGENHSPILGRLKSNNPNASYLVAYVPAEDGRITALVVRSSVTNETHSLVDLLDVFAADVHEPSFSINENTTGFTYRFYDRDKYVLELIDTESRSSKSRAALRKKVRFKQWVDTGYNYGTLLNCRPSSSLGGWFKMLGPTR
jgi:hypothetical protein